MAVKILIQEDIQKIYVYYRYDELFIEIMREHNGWWKPKEKCWVFPLSKKSELREALIKEKFSVTIR